jgi:hypothetical protein
VCVIIVGASTLNEIIIYERITFALVFRSDGNTWLPRVQYPGFPDTHLEPAGQQYFLLIQQVAYNWKKENDALTASQNILYNRKTIGIYMKLDSKKTKHDIKHKWMVLTLKP